MKEWPRVIRSLRMENVRMQGCIGRKRTMTLIFRDMPHYRWKIKSMTW